MTATVYLHPRAVEQNLFAVVSTLKTRGYEVPRQPGQRFLLAVPEPRYLWSSAPPATVLPADRRRPHNFWWPRT